MKSLITYLKNLIKLYLIILIYFLALNCSKNESSPSTPPIDTVSNTSDCKKDQDLKSNTCVNSSLTVDSDSNGLIEIYTLEDLDNVRFNLAGTSRKTSQSDTVWRTAGCPSIVGCRGYELKANIDFSATKWASNCTGSCVSGGWIPIGTDSTPFTATFDGKGFEIRNLYINRSQDYIGLFGYASGTSTLIKSIGVVNAYVKGNNGVGGLVGYQYSGSITNSYVSSSVMNGGEYTGGLVGLLGNQYSGSIITNSYASGSVSGNSYIGGLVGYQYSSSIITNSYASGSVSGSTNSTGGLVGYQNGGSITNNYASGSVSGSSNTGGLVGYLNVGSITNSYAGGSVSGSSNTGGLVGYQYSGSITISYYVSDKGTNGIGNGTCTNSNCIKLNIEDILTLNSLSLKSSFTTKNWDTNFRAGNGHLALLSTDGVRLAGQGMIPNFDTVIKFKQNANSDYTKLLYGNKGSAFNLPSTYIDVGIIHTEGLSFLGWSTNAPTNTISDTNNFLNPNSTYLIPASTLISLTFYPVFNLAQLPQIAGEDGLIWISTAVTLYNMRYSPNGKYYQNGPNGFINTKGCPPVNGCRGYKLLNNIDFNTDSTAINWASNNNIGLGNGGWEPIGSLATPFTATFDGKGFEIRNLYINKPTQNNVGLFGSVSTTSTLINSIGLVNAYINGNNYTGGLVGYQNGGSITNSYAWGSVSGINSSTGGLVGEQNGGSIINSYASGSVSGNTNNGGLVGYQNGGSITNSYAWGSVSGINLSTGGLVGEQNGGSIINSYASGSVSGNTNNGGLVGFQNGGSIINSYASGSVSGINSSTGGLVGEQKNGGSITNSYASVLVSGSDGTGGLVGNQWGSITNSYASGSVNGSGDYIGGFVGAQNNGSSITNSYSSGSVTSSGSPNTGGFVGYQGGSIMNTYWNSMSDQTVAGVSRGEAQKLGIGNFTWSTSSNSANGVIALSTTNFFTNTFIKAGVSTSILDISKFYTVLNSFPKLCYTPLPLGVITCTAAYRISGQD